MLEHLDRDGARRFLAEARRVLRPGGILRLVVPDLRVLASRYMASGDADEFVGAMGMACPFPRGLRELLTLAAGHSLHRWLYDGRSLVALLARSGFPDAATIAPGETRIADPGELPLIEPHNGGIYVEASKR